MVDTVTRARGYFGLGPPVDDGGRTRQPQRPDVEREVVTGEREITQLEHGSGLGFRVVRAVVDTCGGDLETEPDDGATVTLRLPRPA